MHVLEDKHHIICQKIIPTGLFVLLFLTRLLTFYEIKGIRVLNGLDSLMDHKIIFLIFVLMFIAGTWTNFIHIMGRLFLQIISVGTMIIYEIHYPWSRDYKLKYIRYGFWLNMFASFILIFYCIYIYNRSKSGNEKEK